MMEEGTLVINLAISNVYLNDVFYGHVLRGRLVSSVIEWHL